MQAAGIAAEQVSREEPGARRFKVELDNFSGPFDLLLALIAKHEMDITDVALATVTDEFISYLRALQDVGQDWALDEASEFLVLAATLLDLKAARLLPAGEVENDDDLALLEERDLLFARLLQYRAFKEIAARMDAQLQFEGRRHPRAAGLEPEFAALLPELVWRHTPAQFAALAAKVLGPKTAPRTDVELAHLHEPPVKVGEQSAFLVALLTAGMPAGADPAWEGPALTFAELCAQAGTSMVVVVRFLALLELFRDQRVTFEQERPLGELRVRWMPSAAWEERP